MIAKLERIQGIAIQNKGMTQRPNKEWEQQQTVNTNSRTTVSIGTASANSAKFRGIRLWM